MSLVKVTPGRPSILKVEGCMVYVSVHDQFFITEHKRLQQQVYDCHPDRRHFTQKTLVHVDGIPMMRDTKVRHFNHAFNNKASFHRKCKVSKPNSTSTYFKAQRLLERFLEQEIKYYQTLGLGIPEI